MKIIFPSFVIILISHNLFAQQVITFDKAAEQGLRGPHMDSIYPGGIHTDSTIAVFWNNQEEYIKAYEQMLQELGRFLKANDFIWEKPVKGFNRIYFNESGRIDYFIYSFRPDQITLEQEVKFDALLNQFVKNYQFPLQAKSKFAQCSPVTYMPVDK